MENAEWSEINIHTAMLESQSYKGYVSRNLKT